MASNDKNESQVNINPSPVEKQVTSLSPDVLFNRITWVDGGPEALDSKNLNRFEKTLDALMKPTKIDNPDDVGIVEKIVDTLSDEIDARTKDTENVVSAINGNVRGWVNNERDKRMVQYSQLNNRINSFKLDTIGFNLRETQDNKESGTYVITELSISPNKANNYVVAKRGLIDLREVDIPVLSSDRIYVGSDESNKEPVNVATNNKDYQSTQKKRYDDKGSLTYKLKNTDNRIDSFKLGKITVNNVTDTTKPQTIITSIEIDPEIGKYEQTEKKEFVHIETGVIDLREVDIPQLTSDKIYRGGKVDVILSDELDRIDSEIDTEASTRAETDNELDTKIDEVNAALSSRINSLETDCVTANIFNNEERIQVFSSFELKGDKISITTDSLKLSENDIPHLDSNKIYIHENKDKDLTTLLNELNEKADEALAGTLHWSEF